jgi:hypothetical protein
VTRSSSDWVQTADGSWIKTRVPQTRGLSRQHNRFLKDIFKGAATTVVTQRNKDPIYGRYQRLLGLTGIAHLAQSPRGAGDAGDAVVLRRSTSSTAQPRC